MYAVYPPIYHIQFASNKDHLQLVSNTNQSDIEAETHSSFDQSDSLDRLSRQQCVLWAWNLETLRLVAVVELADGMFHVIGRRVEPAARRGGHVVLTRVAVGLSLGPPLGLHRNQTAAVDSREGALGVQVVDPQPALCLGQRVGYLSDAGHLAGGARHGQVSAAGLAQRAGREVVGVDVQPEERVAGAQLEPGRTVARL